MLIGIFIVACIGFLLSLYTYYIEQQLAQNPAYNPRCNLGTYFSCTKPITSAYANLFFVSNSVTGLIFYAIVALLAVINAANLIFYASVAAVLMSLVLAYLLYVKIRTVCVICTALYVINGLLLYLSWGAQ